MEAIIALLHDDWHRLTGPYHCGATRRAFFEGVVNRYREERRHYHTLRHIREVLDIIEEHRAQLENYEAVAFAAWFHDVIYDPRSSDNEERSAALAVRTMRRLQIPSQVISGARDLILMTASHHASDTSLDARLFLDADLAILGSSPERYAEYCRDIRREYSWLDDAEFAEGRRNVLRQFAERDSIFRTAKLRARYERQARENITTELATLNEVNA